MVTIKKLVTNERGDAYASDAVKIIIGVICASIVFSGFFAIMSTKGFPAIQKYLDKAINKNEVVYLTNNQKEWQKIYEEVKLEFEEGDISEDESFIEEWDYLCTSEECLGLEEPLEITADNYCWVLYTYAYCKDAPTIEESPNYKTVDEFKEFVWTDEGAGMMINL